MRPKSMQWLLTFPCVCVCEKDVDGGRENRKSKARGFSFPSQHPTQLNIIRPTMQIRFRFWQNSPSLIFFFCNTHLKVRSTLKGKTNRKQVSWGRHPADDRLFPLFAFAFPLCKYTVVCRAGKTVSVCSSGDKVLRKQWEINGKLSEKLIGIFILRLVVKYAATLNVYASNL